MLFCHLRAMISGRCGCRWCVFARVVDEILEDARLRQEATTVTHIGGSYR